MLNIRGLGIALLILNVVPSIHAAAQSDGLPVGDAWTLGMNWNSENIGQGLPILSLDQAQWTRYRISHPDTVRALVNERSELEFVHRTGWRISAISRHQAQIKANQDVTDLIDAVEVLKNDGPIRPYTVTVQGSGWKGNGLQLGTPWIILAEEKAWRWQADLQWLLLSSFSTTNYAGTVNHLGHANYSFLVAANDSNLGVNSPFLPPSSDFGWGASFSLRLEGDITPAWRLGINLEDVASTLQWAQLATDTRIIDSAIVTRAADGSLNYAPYIKGRRFLSSMQGEMSPSWSVQISRVIDSNEAICGVATLRYKNQAEIEQLWLGWKNPRIASGAFSWGLELEPFSKAIALQLNGSGWGIQLGTDGRWTDTQYARIVLGWSKRF
jgi:hypothetical protein